jgi:hypothetical protein
VGSSSFIADMLRQWKLEMGDRAGPSDPRQHSNVFAAPESCNISDVGTVEMAWWKRFRLPISLNYGQQMQSKWSQKALTKSTFWAVDDTSTQTSERGDIFQTLMAAIHSWSFASSLSD